MMGGKGSLHSADWGGGKSIMQRGGTRQIRLRTTVLAIVEYL